MTVVEFIESRLSEWEREILDHWDSDGRARVATMWTGGDPGYTTVASDDDDGEWVADGREVTDAQHVQVLFDPARVLAQVAAMRAIVDTLTSRERQDDTEEGLWHKIGYDRAAFDVLRHLAAIWSEHPDYDPAWSPS